jgi:hypothetical protein
MFPIELPGVICALAITARTPAATAVFKEKEIIVVEVVL